MNRWDIINRFIKERNYKSYLEVGYYKGWCFDNVTCDNKTAVDVYLSKIPEQEVAKYGKTILHLKSSGIEKLVKLSSDEFFSLHNHVYDIIFIDGKHEAKQVEKDVLNALNHLSENGVIILHDCNPPTEEYSTTGVEECWNGDVYKTVMALKILNPSLYTIDTDWGVGVLEKFPLGGEIEIINELEWKDFEDRKSSIGLISVEEFMQKDLKQLSIWQQTPTLETLFTQENFYYTPPPIQTGNKDLVFVCAQPDDYRFSFQVEVFLENCIKMGYENEIQIILYVPTKRLGTKTERFVEFKDRYATSNPNIKFFWYEDVNNEVLPLANVIDYIPLIRPWVLKKHFEAYPELSQKAIFYHDNDILFNKKLDFDQFLSDDICYMSNTDHYLNVSKYWDTKVKDVLPEKLEAYKKIDILDNLAKMNGISREVCERNDNKTGGAQYILKNIDASYWQDVYNSTITIRQYLRYDGNGVNAQFFSDEDHGFQSWCADMWACLWMLWKRGYETATPSSLDFAWATDDYKKLDRVSIYHDAGVSKDNLHFLFNKNRPEYKSGQILPYEEDFSYVTNQRASYRYVQEILEVKKKYGY